MGTIGISTNGYLAEPPAGQVRYGMADGPTRQWQLVVTAVVTASVATLTVGLRLFTRLQIVRGRVSIDDYLVVAGLVFSIVTVVASLKQTDYGLSYHKWDILFSVWNIWYPVYNIIGTCTYSLSVMFSKLSILFFYLRLSPQRWFRWCTFGLITASIVYSVTYVFLQIFPCQPIQASWDYSIEDSNCLDPWLAYWALSILNIIMDVLTLLLPIPVVVSLQMGKRQKLSLLLIFMTGIFVCTIAIRRTTLIPVLFASSDRPWDSIEDYLLSYAETNLGILCASVPVLKPLFTHGTCCYRLATAARGIWPTGKSAGSRSLSRAGGAHSLSFANRMHPGDRGGASTVEQNRARRLLQMQMQMQARQGSEDDEFEEDTFQLYAADDLSKRNCWYEARDEGVHLWELPSRVGPVGGAADGFEDTVIYGSRPVYNNPNSSGSAEELRGPVMVYDARVTASSPKPVWKNGITVTRETTIRYEREW